MLGNEDDIVASVELPSTGQHETVLNGMELEEVCTAFLYLEVGLPTGGWDQIQD